MFLFFINLGAIRSLTGSPWGITCRWFFQCTICFCCQSKYHWCTEDTTVVSQDDTLSFPFRSLFSSWGGGGVLLYMSYIGMCSPKGVGKAVLVIDRLSILDSLVLNWVCCLEEGTFSSFSIECVRCHAIKNKIKKYATDKVKTL